MEPQAAHPEPPVVSSLPLCAPARRRRVVCLRQDGPVLRVRPDPAARVAALVTGVSAVIIVGFLGVVVLAAMYEGPPPNRYLRYGLIALACATAVAAAALYGYTGGAGADVVFDKDSGTLRGRCWARGGWRRDVACPLSDVASLQVCCRHVEEQDEEDYQTFELNVVLSSPPGERLGLCSHADSGGLMRDAAALATFLGCGILNDCPSLREFPHVPYAPYVRTPTTKA